MKKSSVKLVEWLELNDKTLKHVIFKLTPADLNTSLL